MGKRKEEDLKLKKYFYYLRDRHGLPRITVCLAENQDGIFSRGMALCSLIDSPNKKIGNLISSGRARKAFKVQDCYAPVYRYEADTVIESVIDISEDELYCLFDSSPVTGEVFCKGVYGLNIDELTKSEQELVLNGGRKRR